MLLEVRGGDSFSFWRELHDSRAPVARSRPANDQSPLFQPVDRRCHGTAGQQDLLLDLGDGQRTFVQQRFQRREIGEAQTRIRNALFSQESYGVMTPCDDPP